MATLTTNELEYVIQGYREYKHVWSPEINERLNNSQRTSSLESHTSRVQYPSKKKVPFKKYLMPKGSCDRVRKISFLS